MADLCNSLIFFTDGHVHVLCFVVVAAGALRRSLQDRLSKSSTGKGRDQIYLKLRTSTGLLMSDDLFYLPYYLQVMQFDRVIIHL